MTQKRPNSPWRGLQKVDDGRNIIQERRIPPTIRSAGDDQRITVQKGDTLFSIADAVYGEPTYWYAIMDRNMLDGPEIEAGMELVVPSLVSIRIAYRRTA